jgi:hypothetical protein
MLRSFQSRLGRFHDPIRKKLIDNTISLNGLVADCIKIRVKITKQGDIESRIVEDVNVISAVFPPYVDVPFRRLTREVTEGDSSVVQLKISTLPAAMDLFPIQIWTTQYDQIYLGDLVFRIFYDAQVDAPLVLALQIKEPLGTFGVQSLIYAKYNCTYYDETLPSEMLDVIVATAERRLALQW